MIKLNLPAKLLNPSVPKACCSLVLWFPDCKHIAFQISFPCMCSAHDLCCCELHKLLITHLLLEHPASPLQREQFCVPSISLSCNSRKGLKEERNIVREVNVLVLPHFCVFLVTASSLTLISALCGCSCSFFSPYSCITTNIPVFKCSLNRTHTLNT